MLSFSAIAATRLSLRLRAPLVHNLTSAVAANFTANALLAVGAAPAMVESAEEVAAFAAAADALVINLGSLTPQRLAVMHVAVAAAAAAGTPWLLDPVGAGGIAQRGAAALGLAALGPAAIRGNASEILRLGDMAGDGRDDMAGDGLAEMAAGGRGVDSTDGSERALPAARALAQRFSTIVAVTGATDYVTDGDQVVAIHEGHRSMTRVTAMGCAASAIAAACLAVQPDRLMATAHALFIVGRAGRMAAAAAGGPGTLAGLFLDRLAQEAWPEQF